MTSVVMVGKTATLLRSLCDDVFGCVIWWFLGCWIQGFVGAIGVATKPWACPFLAFSAALASSFSKAFL
jgi:hypothetical protein